MLTAETGFMVLFFVHYQGIHRISSPPTYCAELRLRYSSLFEKDKMQLFFIFPQVKSISFGLPHNATTTAFVSFFNMSTLVSITQYNRLHLYPKMYVTCSFIFLLNKAIIMVMTANRSVHISAGFSAGFYLGLSMHLSTAIWQCL